MFEIKQARKLTDEKWLNLFDVKYVAKTGEEKSWQMATRKKKPKCMTGRYDQPDAVVIVPFHKAKDKLVITREYRVPLNDYEYGFPAGLIDEGESVEQATRRELREETGLNLSRLIKMSPPIYSSAGMTDESVAMVYVECEGEPSNTGNTEFELIEVLLISPAQAFQMCSDSTLRFDAKAWVEISQFAEKRINYDC
ncbi:MAG: NUDIX hydrolase [Desulfobacterales bacterium]|nr:NUDIX hydrolase [Desulfobacterales bacterium]